jgi:hypothetical protein
MARIRSFWLLVVAASSFAFAEDCPNCGKELCEPHALEDKAGVEAAKKGAAAAAPKDRIAALEAYAAICRKHLNCRVASTAKVFGTALNDGDQEVRLRAVALLLETQNPHTAASIAGPHAMVLRQKIEKPPKTDPEKAVWDKNFEFYKALARLLGETGVIEASPAMADLLEAISQEILDVAASNCSRIRTHEVATATLRALERSLGKTCYNKLQAAWATLTGSDVAPPAGGNAADVTRYFIECRKWLKEHRADRDRWLK